MENFNTSKHDYKSLVLTSDFTIKPVYRVFEGKHGTTTQISSDADIVIRRYLRTNDVVVEGAGILNKQEVLDKLPRHVYSWLLNNDGKKLVKGYWWDGTVEGTLNHQRYSRRILSLLRGLNRPDIYNRIMESTPLRSKDIPTWAGAQPFPKILDGKEDRDTYYFVMYPDTSLEVYEFNGVSNINRVEGDPDEIEVSAINSKELQIHNIIRIEILQTKQVCISLLTNH